MGESYSSILFLPGLSVALLMDTRKQILVVNVQ